MVLLPDALFFARSVPIAAGATAAEATAQAELALEGLAPFPLAQLYHGTFWLPGAESALVFAAYRRRFTTEQTASWADAELVLPAFAAVLGGAVAPGSTVLLTAPDGVTAVQWEKSPVPSRVTSRPLDAALPDEERVRLVREFAGSLAGAGRVIEIAAPLAAESAGEEGAVEFRAGDFVSRLAAPAAAPLDVRDKAALAALRRSRQRDVLLWRAALGAAAALLLLGLGELGLIAGRKLWHQPRQARVAAQSATVGEIMKSQQLANRIDELATKRLLPFEMIAELTRDDRKPAEIQFDTATTDPKAGIYTIIIDARTTNMGQLSTYVATLRRLPMIQSVETRDERTRNDGGTFRLIVVFKPDQLKPADSIAQ
ncbi:MAG: hypothetical protein JNL39_18885 [Opitutaceae bacterium]|nr:hypothetical protein [Opitutaceae bacterium]